ncbi:MAG: hypothetical protein GX184_05730 [Clostridiaceae bacterium]|nr:hypothetical protein [Clostridiaceae bacterium]
MDGNLTKALWIGVSILLFIAVVTVGIGIFSQMRDASNTAAGRLESITKNMEEEGFRRFDGNEVSGSQVLSAISEYSDKTGEFIILVATLGSNGGNAVDLKPESNTVPDIGKFTEYISETNGSLKCEENCIILSGSSDELLTSKSANLRNAQRRDAENSNLTSKYINPSGTFISHLIYDENLVIKGIAFAQKE